MWRQVSSRLSLCGDCGLKQAAPVWRLRFQAGLPFPSLSATPSPALLVSLCGSVEAEVSSRSPRPRPRPHPFPLLPPVPALLRSLCGECGDRFQAGLESANKRIPPTRRLESGDVKGLPGCGPLFKTRGALGLSFASKGRTMSRLDQQLAVKELSGEQQAEAVCGPGDGQ